MQNKKLMLLVIIKLTLKPDKIATSEHRVILYVMQFFLKTDLPKLKLYSPAAIYNNIKNGERPFHYMQDKVLPISVMMRQTNIICVVYIPCYQHAGIFKAAKNLVLVYLFLFSVSFSASAYLYTYHYIGILYLRNIFIFIGCASSP